MDVRRHASWIVLAACIAAALLFRRFVFVAFYPVVMSAAFALAFGLSLLRTPLCEEIARRMPPHVLPPGGAAYARRLTAVWCGVIALNGLIALATVFAPRVYWFAWNCAASYVFLGTFAAGEWFCRRRRFAVTFHTSGSTAKPKRIVKTFASLAKEVAYHLKASVRVPPDAVFLATIEEGHMYGKLWRELMPAAAGRPCDPEVIRTPEALLAKMAAAEKVFLVTTPSFLDRFCAYADQYEVPRNCAEIVTSGALLDARTSAAAKRVFGVAPLEIFGSTETGGVARRRQDAPDCDWTVLDPVKVAVNGEGRLVVTRSPFSFCRNYVMGDGAVLSPDGRSFRLLGRMDRMVKINEERVSLPEMEERMKALADVKEAALVALAGEHGDVLGAVIAFERQPDGTAAVPPSVLEMRKRLLPLFPKGTVPKRFRFVEALPRNPQGKVRAADLRALFEGKQPGKEPQRYAEEPGLDPEACGSRVT